ncbi:hypothetical protein, partial [Streptomyces sp. 8L]|uniref:hypothetical protein n=1 Tax=Streptomyces sp. 8L TaxID=2877242 RepID=UPI001CD4BF0B
MNAGTITALNWNVEKGVNWEEAAAWVQEQDPDILFQQEVQPGQLDGAFPRESGHVFGWLCGQRELIGLLPVL